MDKENIILKYPGSINNFRSLMDGLIEGFDRRWKFSDSQFLAFTYRPDLRAPGREVWLVYLAVVENGEFSRQPYEGATILAVEGIPNETKVSFLDGRHLRTASKQSIDAPGSIYSDQKLKIGDGLILFSKEIEKQWRIEDHATPFEDPVLQDHQTRGIEAVEYLGSVSHFRAWMDRFLAKNRKTYKGTWEGHPIEYEIGYYLPAQTNTREVWNVYFKHKVVINSKSPGDSHFAMILATEDRPNFTMVEFIDGQCYQRTSQQISNPATQPPVFGNVHLSIHKPIGDDFIRMAEWIRSELPEALKDLDSTPQEPKTNNLNEWFEYFHKVKHLKRITLRDIAKKTGYSYDYVREKHGHFKKEREETDII